jgi:hypothetical protein
MDLIEEREESSSEEDLDPEMVILISNQSKVVKNISFPSKLFYKAY